MVGTLVSPWGWKKVGIEIADDKKSAQPSGGRNSTRPFRQ